MDKIISALIAGLVALGISLGVASTVKMPEAHSTSLGSIAGYDIPSPFLKWGGVASYQAQATLKTATTTPCAIQSPAATSTLIGAVVRVDTASSSATVWDIAKATTAFATTTAIGTSYTIGANAQATIQASTSPTSGLTVISPNTWIVFGVRQGISTGDTAGTGFAPSGQCQAEFTAI